MSEELLKRCMEAATQRGVDLQAPYEPWMPVDLMQTLLLGVHEYTGLSWFGAIMLAVLGIRIITLPLSIAAIRGSREKAVIQAKFHPLIEKMKDLSGSGQSEKVNNIQKQLQELQQKHGKFYMLKGTWNLICVQMPIYITAVYAMRGFADHPNVFRSFAMEGPLWLDSLALADPYCVLPIFTSAVMLTNREIFGSVDTEEATSQLQQTPQDPNAPVAGQDTHQKYSKWIIRGSLVIFVPVMWSFPAGTFVWLSTNVIMAAMQNRLLKLPWLERLFEIPPTKESIAAADAAATAGSRTMWTPLASTVRKYDRDRRLQLARQQQLRNGAFTAGQLPTAGSSLAPKVSESLLLRQPSEVAESATTALVEGGSRALAEGGPRALAAPGTRALAQGGSRALAPEGPRALAESGSRALASPASRELAEGGSRALAAPGSRELAPPSPRQLAPTNGARPGHNGRPVLAATKAGARFRVQRVQPERPGPGLDPGLGLGG